MIGISRLYCGELTSADGLRYGRRGDDSPNAPHAHAVARSAAERRPVTVWNSTRTCNLRCIHCYTDSECRAYPEELTTEEAKAMIKDLASFEIPALLFSGGEPLARKDIFELIAYARSLGLRPVLSTNGTLITADVARRLKEAGVIYVGISLDGLEGVNDYFRGVEGAFSRAIGGFRACHAEGQRVGLRLTLTRHNFRDLHGIFDLIEREGIERACFYHLVYAGRGHGIAQDDLTHRETREAIDIILERTQDFHRRGLKKDILTVDNHVDGIYLYMKLKERAPERAEEVLKLLTWNGGGAYSSGVGIADIDFRGDVHPDQFWMHYSFGNVRERPFSQIWADTSDPLMAGLKDRKPLLKGRCGACRWLDACGGSMRVRAEAVFGDPWAPEPACYLTDEEIGLGEDKKRVLEAKGEEFAFPEALLK